MFESRMSQPAARNSSGVSVLTDPAVPTGMNAGVSTSPWAVRMRPARAAVPGSVASSVKEKGIEPLGLPLAPGGRRTRESRAAADRLASGLPRPAGPQCR